MSIMDFIDFLKLNVSGVYYPLDFPANAKDNCMFVGIIGGTARVSGVGEINLQVVIRDTHPSKAEAKALEMIQFLDKQTNKDLNGTHLIYAEALQPYPLYAGEDENHRHMFSTNFRLIIN
jgi:hypothetical protein